MVADPAEDGRRAVGIEPDDERGIGPENPADLVGDRSEDLARGHTPGHERRYATQCGLLLEELMNLGATLRIGDCGSDELGEVDEALLGVVRERSAP